MTGICEGRVAIVTGAGRGLGREHAFELARQGARVVVNDLGSSVDGSGSSAGPANEVVEAIRRIGAQAVVNADDVSDWDGARRLVETAIETFGGLDVLVNNAGILRDRMIVNMTLEEWDDVIRVHLRGTFAPTHWAARYWRDRAKEGEQNDARVICTSSSSGIYGNVGQTNYGTAKAGIASFTIIASKELERYGVTVNAIAPGARTRMTEELARARGVADPSPGEWDPRDPAQCRTSRSRGSQAASRGTSPAGCSTSRAAGSASPKVGMLAQGWTRATAGRLRISGRSSRPW